MFVNIKNCSFYNPFPSIKMSALLILDADKPKQI